MVIIVIFAPKNKYLIMRCLIAFFIVLTTSLSFSQTTNTITTESYVPKHKKGRFYISWGYTTCIFSKSDIRFVDRSNKYHPATGKYNDYDFTIYNVTAKDREDFDKISDVKNISVPQFVIHIGYYFNNKKDFGVELNYDHTKYVMDSYQKVRIKGQFNGNYVDHDTVIDPDNFLSFEHTDGANFMMFNFIKRWKLYQPSKKFNIGYVIKPGIGFVYPRTDVTLFGERLNNDWHVAGWIAGVETGFRVEFLKYGMLEVVAKGAYADYRKALVLGKGNGTASHHFWAGQLTLTIGASF